MISDFTPRKCKIFEFRRTYLIMWLWMKIKPSAEILSIICIFCDVDKIALNLIDGQNTSRKGKIPKMCTIGISVKKHPKILEFIRIGPIILEENACRSLAILSIGRHIISLNKAYKFWSKNIQEIIKRQFMVPDFPKA